jgi:predicted nucleic acid-binding protein
VKAEHGSLLFLDSSALVKLYVEEQGSAAVERLLHQPGMRAACGFLAYPEVTAALVRRQRGGDLTRRTLERLLRLFESDWRKFLVVWFAPELVPLSGRLVRAHGVKGADAVQLACALLLGRATATRITLVAADQELLRAAALEGLATISP